MADVVVTVPKRLWQAWLDEGCLPGQDPMPGEYFWFNVPTRPRISSGERVYVVAHGLLRGYAPLFTIEDSDGMWRKGALANELPDSPWFLVRRGGAVAVTIDEPIRGFQGYRYQWWSRDDEHPFENWMTEGVVP